MRNLLFRSKTDSSPAEAARSDNALTVPGRHQRAGEGMCLYAFRGEPRRRPFSTPELIDAIFPVQRTGISSGVLTKLAAVFEGHQEWLGITSD
jgi:hypothetical protein